MSSISRFAQRTALKLNQKSPQILFGAGVVGAVGTVVLASRAALKAQPVIQRHNAVRSDLEAELNSGQINQDQMRQEVLANYMTTGTQLVRLYGPVALVGVGSLVALTKSHQILRDRNTALTVAYTGLHQAFESYRARVVNELGEQKDSEFLHGTITQEVEVEGKNGKMTKKEITSLDPEGITPYSYLFDEKNRNWVKDPGYNHTYLENQQQWANHMLKINGYLFLNDVLDMLGIDRTHAGQVVGWVYDKDMSNGDGYVDFGHRRDGEFVAGYEPSVWLDFNVDGPIWDLLP